MSEKLSKTRSKVPGLKRVPSGIPGFDDMIGGGFLPGSVIIVAGGGGTGKSIFALQSFLSQKFSAGNRGLIISFEENPEEIKSICGSFGLKIPAAVKIMYFNPNTLNAKAILKTISSELKKGVRHLLINSATSIKMKDDGLESFLKEAVTLLKHAGAGAFICMHGAMRENLQGIPDVLIELSVKRNAENISRRITVLKSRSTVLKVSSSKIEFGAKGLAAGSFPEAAENTDNIINTSITFDDLDIDGHILEGFKKAYPNLRLRFVKKDAAQKDPFTRIGELKTEIRLREFKYDLISESFYGIQELAKEKLILPISGYLREIAEQEYFPGLREICSYDGELYSLPRFIQPFGLIYRKDIFKKHRVKVPATAGELVDIIKFLLKKEKSFKRGICFPGGDSIRHCLYTHSLTGGPDFKTFSGKIFDLNAPEVETALAFLRDCIYKHKIAPVPDMNADPLEYAKKVINGEALSAEYWAYGDISRLMKTDRSLEEKIGFDTIPVLYPGAKPVSMICGGGYAVPATAKYPTRAAEVLKFITSYEQDKFIKERGNYPALTGRIDVWRELEKKIPYYMNATKFLETAYLPDERIHKNKHIGIVMDCCRNVLVNRADIKEALAAANEKIKHWKRTSFYHKASEDAKKFMEQNYSRKINMNEIARSVNLSPHFFTKVFKENSGVTFYDYLSEVRLNRAKKLLRENYRMNINEIASVTGFSSAFHFSAVFKKWEGITPSDYRISG